MNALNGRMVEATIVIKPILTKDIFQNNEGTGQIDIVLSGKHGELPLDTDSSDTISDFISNYVRELLENIKPELKDVYANGFDFVYDTTIHTIH